MIKAWITRHRNFTIFFSIYLISLTFWWIYQPTDQNLQIPSSALFFTLVFTALSGFFMYHHEAPIEKKVCCILLCFGFLSLILTPILGVPDEVAHFARSEATSRLDFFPKQNDDTTYNTIQTVEDLSLDAQKLYQVSTIRHKSRNLEPAKTFDVARQNFFVSYLPQALGIFIAKALRLPPIWLMWLGRLCNLLCASFLAYHTIKIAPQYKEVFAFVWLLPMTVFQAASCSPDATINGFALLTLSYFIKLYFKKEKTVGMRECTILALMTIGAGMSKVTYFVLICLLLTIPQRNFKLKRPVLSSLGLIGCLFILCLVILKSGTSTIGLNKIDYLAEQGIHYGDQIAFIFNHPRDFIYIMLKAIANVTDKVNTIFIYGWFEYEDQVATKYFPYVYGSLTLLAGKPGKKHLSLFAKIGLLTIAFVIFLVTNFSMYIPWTTVGALEISGVQGRYFMPLFAILPLVFQVGVIKESHIEKVFSFYTMASLVFLTGGLLITYLYTSTAF